MKKILIIQTAFIGDAILATALLEACKKQWPAAHIDLLVRKGNESLFNGHPFLKEVLIWNKQPNKYRSLFQLKKRIKQKQYDAVINLQRFGATGFLTAFSGAKIRVGFKKNPFSFLFTHAVSHRWGDGTHEVDRNMDLLRTMEETIEAANPKLYPGKADESAVAHLQKKPYICLAPTSVWYTKQFPSEQWVSLMNHQKVQNYKVYLLGAPSDFEACETIKKLSAHSGVENLCGQLSLLQSASLMQGAIMNYVNDSAPLHLCSAVNAPVTAIYCSTVPAFGFGPLSDKCYVVETTTELSCRPCGMHGYQSCPKGHFKCAKEIKNQQLLMGLETFTN